MKGSLKSDQLVIFSETRADFNIYMYKRVKIMVFKGDYFFNRVILGMTQSPCSDHTIEQESSINDSPGKLLPNLTNTDNRLNKILITASHMFKSQDQQEVENGINQVKLLIEKINFLKANNKEYDKKIEFICYYNASCGYQTLVFTKTNNSIEQCLRYIEKSIELLKDLIKENSTYWFKLTSLLIRTQLQYCALLSQIQNHRKALDVGIQTIDLMIDAFKKSLNECLNTLNQKKTTSDNIVSFSRNILNGAKEYLVEMAKIQSYSSIMETNHEDFRKIKEKNYFWKDNFENNEKTFRKQLKQTIIKDNDTNRNALGLKVNNNWIHEFSIGKIMHMKPLNYVELSQPDNLLFEFSYRNIIQKIILVSVTYFSIATQMRFIENEKEKNHGNHKKDLKKSEIFHLKSIEIICKNIKESSIFVNHLINSYQRHYYHDLITIDEEPSYAQYSIVSSHISRKNTHLNAQEKPYDQEEKKKQRKTQKNLDGSSLFWLKTKNTHLFMKSNEANDDRFISFDRSHQNEIKKQKNTKRFKVKIEKQKSTSTSNFHSYRSTLKKSHSSKGTGIKPSKSPQPSINALKNIKNKPSKKKSRRVVY